MAEPTQQYVPAREYYPTVTAVIIHKDKVLLRRDEKQFNWLSPSTHIGIDETPIDALFRHVRAETGLPQNNLVALLPYIDNLSIERDESESTTQPLPFDVDIHRVGQDKHFHVDSAYILVSNTDELTPEADTPPELEWFSAEELEDLMLSSKATIGRAHYALKRYKENPPE